MGLSSLASANVRRHPGRSMLLGSLVALLAFTMLAGALVLTSLSRGLKSLEDRLGADIIVAPKTAKSTNDLQQVMLDGVPGSFYMDASVLGDIAALEGVEQVSPQYYLATLKSGCCSMPIQVIGFDPATDFSIQPWIARSYASELGLLDVVAGCQITGAPGSTVTFYGVECRIVAKLDETGTSLDTAVFATSDTVRRLVQASQDLGRPVMAADKDPAQMVSTVQVRVSDGYDVADITNEINLHMRGVWATQARAMTSGVADGITGVSRVIRVVMVVVWVLAVAVLLVAFSMLGRQRTREFAALRVMGASRADLTALVLRESLMISAVGAVVGTVLAACVVVAFKGALESALGLPFLLPGGVQIGAFALLAFALSLVAGPVASALSAHRLSSVDTGQILREE